jgi:5-methylthioadenosine/S-adenosylhomocysteine deaminase
MTPDKDLLIVGGDIVTMDAKRQVVAGATLAISGGNIAAIGTADELRARFPGAGELSAKDCVVIPGMVNAHQHTTADPFARSAIPDDITSQQSIFEWIVPMHSQVDGDDDELAATLTAIESLTNGVTTLLEPGTVAHPLRVAAGLTAAGIRGRVGQWGWDVEGLPYSGSTQECLARQEETVKALPAGSLVTGWITLVGHDLASDELFAGAAELADRLDVGVTWHISPGPTDIESYAARSGLRPVTHLRRLGVLGPRLLLGHAVWLDDAEVDAILETRAAVVSCPGAYLRLGQGYTRASRHAELVKRGGRLAVGCDAHNAGDVSDVLHSAYLLAALERDRAVPGEGLRADQVFALATIDGADAVGMGEMIGSIEVGKVADVVVIDASGPTWNPRGDLALHLIWGAASRNVRDVVVDGRIVVRDRQVVGLDVPALLGEARDRAAALLRRAGIEIPHRWPTLGAADYDPAAAR